LRYLLKDSHPLFTLDESAHPQLRQVDLLTLTADESKSFHTASVVLGHREDQFRRV